MQQEHNDYSTTTIPGSDSHVPGQEDMQDELSRKFRADSEEDRVKLLATIITGALKAKWDAYSNFMIGQQRYKPELKTKTKEDLEAMTLVELQNFSQILIKRY